jgi:hypothetical protein
MPALETRLAPLARLLVSVPGQGDPVKVGEELTWLGILAYEWQFGTYSRDSNGLSKLEALQSVGLACRPYYVPKDTRLSHYTTSGGSWEERKPATGSPRVYYLVQYDTTAGTVFSATSTFDLPANASFAISLTMAATPPDWDSAALPQYVRVEWGGGKWALHVNGDGTFLQRKVAGAWESPVQLRGGSRAFGTGKEAEEAIFFVRVLNGALYVSSDFGQGYDRIGNASPSQPVNVAAGPVKITGQGGQVLFGLHQLLYQTGTFTSRDLNTLTSRAFGTTATLTPYDYRPTGTTVALADQSAPASSRAAWRATLTPHSSAGTPFDFWFTPQLFAVLFEYPVQVTGGSGTYTEPFDGDEGEIVAAHVSKPYELDQGNATVTIRRDATQPFVWSAGRWLKVQLWLGHENEDGSEYLTPVKTGYIEDPCTRAPAYRDCSLTLQVEHLTTRFKRTSWTKRTRPYFRGMTVNQALDRILYSEGLFTEFIPGFLDFSAFRLWHVAGNVPIPPGSYEEPNEYEYPPVEPKWATIERLCGLACVELGATDAGGFFTLPKDDVNAFLSQLWEAEPTAELLALIQDISFRLRSAESATVVEVYGRTEWGEEVMAWTPNPLADVPGSAFFTPWRETIQEELPGTVDAGAVTLRAQSLARQAFPLKFEADLTTPVRLGISRRDQGQVVGVTQTGVAVSDRFCVLTIEHTYRAGPGLMGECSTVAGLRRLT